MLKFQRISFVSITYQTVDDVLKNLENDTKEMDVNHDAYVGTYFSDELYSSLVIKNKNGRLVISHPRMNDIVLTHTKYNNFGFIEFSADTCGKIRSLKVLGEDIRFVKVDP